MKCLWLQIWLILNNYLQTLQLIWFFYLSPNPYLGCSFFFLVFFRGKDYILFILFIIYMIFLFNGELSLCVQGFSWACVHHPSVLHQLTFTCFWGFIRRKKLPKASTQEALTLQGAVHHCVLWVSHRHMWTLTHPLMLALSLVSA